MKKLNITIFVFLLMLFLAACGSDEGSTSSEGDSESEKNAFWLVEDGKLTFAASGEFKPFSYMEGTKMVGYDIAVGKAIANKLGLEPNPQRAKFSGIVTGVTEGRYDIAVASHTITEERLKQVNFSQPYYYSGPVIYTRPDSEIQAPEDLEGKEVSVARGTTYIEMATEYTDNIPQVDSDVVALQSLAKGHHDAVITDDVTGITAIDNGLKIENRGQLGVSEQAIAIGKDNNALLKAVNEALQEMKENGELQELSEKWVGGDITQKPETVD
ncbi:transporter substrate-binding domain-containing protein [Virgibacillus sp. AGTR]|uniref:transporter substrate-binding domain-containing protein n=1 Tax=unclassified Virgibacillus TaxID=2620237 RepID=UPI001962D280|nr:MULTISPECIES: transporter substrate-binding domain-containing protein [unclassified Virgibacillus]MCC2252198.1 transporter substrate-binding domain-containing protein [Virgibacillus sp. AGTR]MDY7046396.1 transporter substrate-binding domain-containing protein [Virgibacillus sp. M23]QRZ17608.1 transporter substrate-binding domain-containing protein [Virgibacillus sp. AGTR]